MRACCGCGRLGLIFTLASPIWVPLTLALVLLLTGWGVLGWFFTHPTLFAALGVSTLSGLIVKQVAVENGQIFFKSSYDYITWDAALIAICVVLAAGLYDAARFGKDRRGVRRPGFLPSVLLWSGALLCLVYVIIKGSVTKLSQPLSGLNQALLTLSVLFPLIQVLLALKCWRWANNEDVYRYEGEVFRAALPGVPFYQYDAPANSGAAMHTVAFGEPAIKFAKEAQQASAAAAVARAKAQKKNDDLASSGAAGAGTSSGSSVSGRPLPSAPVILWLHGYMSGTGMHFFNVKPFLDGGYKVYALDWLGGGGSDRPHWWPTSTEQMEDFFIGALDGWVRAHGLEDHKVIIMAHSLGGYLASCYTLKYPHRVKHLVLASPAAMPSSVNTPPGLPPASKTSPTPRPIPPFLWKTVSYFWERNLTPGMILRYLGPIGETCARRATKGRFSRMLMEIEVSPAVTEPLGRYFYHSLAGEGSGEFALAHAFHPGARGKNPVGPRLLAAARSGALPSGLPISMLFGGTHDWMLSREAHPKLVRELNDAGLKVTLYETPKSGHHLYLESPTAFNQLVLKDLATGNAGAGTGAATTAGAVAAAATSGAAAASTASS